MEMPPSFQSVKRGTSNIQPTIASAELAIAYALTAIKTFAAKPVTAGFDALPGAVISG
jgi:hypothetical protein